MLRYGFYVEIELLGELAPLSKRSRDGGTSILEAGRRRSENLHGLMLALAGAGYSWVFCHRRLLVS